ncbi:MAG: hypothetical protein HY263_06365, partial [Chloroflexi bacterium]|nr:hypothetical protein [Chloroflexota bacterium]
MFDRTRDRGGSAGGGTGGGMAVGEARDPFGSLLQPEGEGERHEQYLELIGTHLRASGVVDLGRFRRVTDYVNLLDGFFALRDVVLLTRTGEATRITLPELRVRLDEVAIVGQLVAEEMERSSEVGVHLDKVSRRIVVMTAAHIIYGFVHTLEGANLMAFLDSPDPKFMPMARVRVRWLADRRLAARY